MKFIGFLGMFLIQFSTVFQLLKFYQSKKTEGVSIIFWWMVLGGLMCYLIYAVHIKDIVYITSNIIGILFSSVSIYLYYHYRKGGER